MSLVLLDFAKSFIDGRISALVFSEAYIELWRIERDKNLLLADGPKLSECLSSIFCAADMYCADDKLRRDYEFNAEQLRAEVCVLVEASSQSD
jgi:hypothetical protein